LNEEELATYGVTQAEADVAYAAEDEGVAHVEGAAVAEGVPAEAEGVPAEAEGVPAEAEEMDSDGYVVLPPNDFCVTPNYSDVGSDGSDEPLFPDDPELWHRLHHLFQFVDGEWRERVPALPTYNYEE